MCPSKDAWGVCVWGGGNSLGTKVNWEEEATEKGKGHFRQEAQPGQRPCD